MNKCFKYGLIVMMLISCLESSYAQVQSFTKSSDLIKAKKGDTILVMTDSAYVLSGKRADFLNDKLNELDTIKSMYNDQSKSRKELIEKIEELDKLIMKLRSENIKDSVVISQGLNSVIIELNQLSADLRKNNHELKENNIELQKRVIKLEELIGELKKEMRGIWWNGISDKVLAFTIGIATGAVLVLLL